MKTVFMGTPEIAVPALRRLAAHTEVGLVITQPDRPAGRGNVMTPPPVKQAALALGLRVWQPETLKGTDAAERLRGADAAVVLAYGELLRQDVLDAPRLGCINLHASLLPRWRGASPLQAAIRAGDPRTGMTVMRMVRGLDAGPMLLDLPIDLPGDATLPWLHDRMAELGAEAIDRWLAVAGTVTPVLQNDAAATHCRKLTSEDGHLAFDRSATEVERWIRAYNPAPGTWAMSGGERLRILAAAVRAAGPSPGACAVVDGELLIGCQDGAIAVLRLQSPGGKALSAADWLRGHAVPASLA
jgi:methionyl-tRNA formyltransferase